MEISNQRLDNRNEVQRTLHELEQEWSRYQLLEEKRGLAARALRQVYPKEGEWQRLKEAVQRLKEEIVCREQDDTAWEAERGPSAKGVRSLERTGVVGAGVGADSSAAGSGAGTVHGP